MTPPPPQYESGMAAARSRLAEGRWARRIATRDFSPEQLEAFLLHFASLGVAMTRPVDGWIRRAGEQAVVRGYRDLGAALITHARHEAGHDALFADDTRALAARWNRHGPPVDPDVLLQSMPTPGVEAYVRLHEDLIAGPAPYAQIAVEYEIERLSVEIGPGFVEACIAICGPEIRTCLSFVDEHVRLDEAHTHFNARQLTTFLAAHPEALPDLLAAGSGALDAYGHYLEDCLDLAQDAFGV